MCFLAHVLHQLVLIPDVLSDVGLVKAHYGHGVRVTAVRRRLCRHAESQREVTHGVHDDALVLVRVFRDPAEARLDDVVAVEELLLGRRLEPDLVLRVRHQVVESRHVEPELSRLGKLAETGAQGKQVLSRHMGCLWMKSGFNICH